VANLTAFNWWRLFHCFLRHNNTEDEAARAEAVWSWMGDHYATLKKISVGYELDLLGAIWKLAVLNRTLPSFNLVRETIEAMDANEGSVEALREYTELTPQFSVYPAAELEAVLKSACNDFEMAVVSNTLRIALNICDGSIEVAKKKYSGPADALKYLHQRQERGLLVKPNQTLRPINVNTEAATIRGWYKEYLNTKFLPTGIFDNQSGREVLLETSSFVGILGYLHDGKSPVARHILYTMAAAGHNVLHISLENPGMRERNKFILQHAHNPKFDGRYASLSYAKLRLQLLTDEEQEMLDEVGADFEASIGGQIVIEQMGIASWEAIKTKIEEHHGNHPLAAVCIDYLQLIDPPNDGDADQRSRFTSMVKDVRQFQMTFDGGRGICLISPVQGNEAGHDRAMEEEGVWSPSGVNNEKELARSMDFIMGVSNRGRIGGLHDLVFSFPKDRESGEFLPFAANMTGCGWIGRNDAKVAAQKYVDPNKEAMERATNLTEVVEHIPVEFPE
jgi:hypothetical protein